MNTHDADRQMPASANTAAAPYPRSDQIQAFVNALVQGDRDGARDIFDAALVREQYPRVPTLAGGRGLRWTDAAAWSDLVDVLCIASLDVLDTSIRQLDGTGLGQGSEFGATPIIAPDQD